MAGVVMVLLFGKAATRWNLLAKLYDIRISKRGIEFIVFSGFVFYTLKFGNIDKVIEGHGRYHFLTACDFRNRFFGSCLLILKKKGFFTRKVLVTPNDQSAFVRRLIEAGVTVEEQR